MHLLFAVSGVDIPHGIRVASEAFQHADARAEQKAFFRMALPGEQARLNRIIEHILRLPRAQGILRAVDGGVAEIEAFHLHRGLDSGKVQALKIGRPPDVRRRVAHVVNAIVFAALKEVEFAAHFAAFVEIDAAFVAPSRFRTQIGRAEIGRVMVVQIGIRGQAECAAG